jgi:glycosyltransferase involved in cell wall biosynthesis
MSDYNLTVIVPVYNGEKYLESCLESIAVQTLENMEVIVIDDGSTDDSADIARSFEEKYNHFAVVRQQNSGRSAARNTGLNRAKGKFIAFLDADDFLDPSMYEKLLQTAAERQSEVVRCGAVQFDDASGRIIKHRREFHAFTEITTTENLLKAYFDKRIDRVVWNGIYHSSLFKEVRFPEGKEYEDQYVTPELLAHTNKYIYIPNSYYYYRKHPEAFTNAESFTADSKADKVQSLNTLYQIIEEKNLKKELSYHYSRYFYFMILDYHNPTIYNKPGYLRKGHKSIDNLILPEAFEYVLENHHLDQREVSFMRLMRMSHFLFFPIQKVFRVWDLIYRANISTQESNQKEKTVALRNSQNYLKLIEIYA